jgi:NAD(P)-dependent dehydrogenase (short-subunit alcohol dehydrogenase family)
MLLENKTAIVYGGSGSVGGAVAREGAHVFLADRTPATLDRVAEVADVATLMTSDRAGAMTGVIANVTCGYIVD